jgi:uncharacterized protein
MSQCGIIPYVEAGVSQKAIQRSREKTIMLVEFSVENHLSFNEKATLSMIASKDKSLPENIIYSAQGTGIDLLRSAVIYGANCSGKSNLLSSLEHMISFVDTCLTQEEGVGPYTSCFKLDKACASRPSTFEITFLSDGVRYDYGFSIDSERVRKEWYYSYPKKQKRVLFERRWEEKEEKDVYKFSSWDGAKNTLVEKTPPNALFITVAAMNDHKTARIATDWLLKFEKVHSFSDLCYGSNVADELLIKDAVSNSIALGILKKLDPSIQEIAVNTKPPVDMVDIICKQMPDPRGYKDMMKQLSDEARKATAKTLRGERDSPIDSKARTEVKIMRGIQENDQKDVSIPLGLLIGESTGMQIAYAIIVMMLKTSIEKGTLWIDDFGVHLHPFVSRFLIKTFHSGLMDSNAQMIINTHDTMLLDQELFRRDQIWFTEKRPTHSTDLYSLWDFKNKTPRKHENIRNGYLAGRYGAIPSIEDTVE